MLMIKAEETVPESLRGTIDLKNRTWASCDGENPTNISTSKKEERERQQIFLS